MQRASSCLSTICQLINRDVHPCILSIYLPSLFPEMKITYVFILYKLSLCENIYYILFLYPGLPLKFSFLLMVSQSGDDAVTFSYEN